MSNTPWHPEYPFVSPWNYAPEVRAGFDFARCRQAHAVMLREGEQYTGIVFTNADEIRIVPALAEARGHRVEAAMPVGSQSASPAIREIVRRTFGPRSSPAPAAWSTMAPSTAWRHQDRHRGSLKRAHQSRMLALITRASVRATWMRSR